MCRGNPHQDFLSMKEFHPPGWAKEYLARVSKGGEGTQSIVAWLALRCVLVGLSRPGSCCRCILVSRTYQLCFLFSIDMVPMAVGKSPQCA